MFKRQIMVYKESYYHLTIKSIKFPSDLHFLSKQFLMIIWIWIWISQAYITLFYTLFLPSFMYKDLSNEFENLKNFHFGTVPMHENVDHFVIKWWHKTISAIFSFLNVRGDEVIKMKYLIWIIWFIKFFDLFILCQNTNEKNHFF